jgi:hypothetical protein
MLIRCTTLFGNPAEKPVYVAICTALSKAVGRDCSSQMRAISKANTPMNGGVTGAGFRVG